MGKNRHWYQDPREEPWVIDSEMVGGRGQRGQIQPPLTHIQRPVSNLYSETKQPLVFCAYFFNHLFSWCESKGRERPLFSLSPSFKLQSYRRAHFLKGLCSKTGYWSEEVTTALRVLNTRQQECYFCCAEAHSINIHWGFFYHRHTHTHLYF